MHVALLSLGGTISMSAVASGGIAPTLSSNAILARFGIDLGQVEITPISFRQLASAQLSLADLVEAARKIHELKFLGASGVVVTQGTDTIEETAFALDLLGPENFPIVVTGAMRHPDAPGSDGAANLRDAILLASCTEARRVGVVVTMDGEVHAARYVMKANTLTVRAFRSAPIGRIGHVWEDRIELAVDRLSPPISKLSLPDVPLPAIAVLKASLGDDGRIADRLAEFGYEGAVIEGLGAGHVHPVMAASLESLARDMPVVMSTRAVGSHVLRNTYGFVGSEIDLIRRGMALGGWLTTAKLHILLSLLIASGRSRDEIGRVLRDFGGQ